MILSDMEMLNYKGAMTVPYGTSTLIGFGKEVDEPQRP
jgi:hypothetical protein